MSNDILNRLQAENNRFSKGQRAIARFISESYDKAAFMTANAIGRAVGVSESTVVRFAVELGYDGYPSMQKAMQEMVVNRLTSVQRIEVMGDRIGKQDLLTTVIQSDIEKLRQTADTVSRQDFQAAVDSILKARRVFVLGVRSTAPLANFLGYYLSQMLDTVHVVTSSGTSSVFEKVISADERDAVIAFSFPRYSTSTAQGAEYCRSKGATVIGITDSMNSPLGRNCDRVLLAKSDMISLVDSLTAPLSICNALIVAIAARREREIQKKFSELEQLWEKYNVYEKQGDR
jgi:DNA-binding MurR/RpiR family transcriptional regulator